MKCEICKGKLNEGGADSKIIIEEPAGITKWAVCDVCSSAVFEFILEFKDDLKNSFKDHDATWKLSKEVYRQRKLEVES